MSQNTCLVCSNTFEGRAGAKYCSPRCRVKAGRKRNTINVTESPNVTLKQQTVTDNVREGLSKTDKTFYDRAMKDFGNPYYEFTNNSHERTCYQCDKDYTTSLELNKYCSYHHLTTASHPTY